ncbi:hypothetical protein BDV95DRAFT_565032 [Massariosphaeria phaeospora]|uniref:ubiquitinyl hydrolase 1 n=1 Tax=Massariosphaeria phaeospora TaxID=100035 RepID=A0A7C8MD84_9PLEO|nr:hypothetical protein BDV95DRAFT_565032 [Massariosphaeria phaeospora]
MHDEVFEATQDAGAVAKELTASAASSPSEAYANMTLDSRESTATASDRTRPMAHPEQPSRPPPRSSSPAKRLHSDMDDAGNPPMDLDAQGSSTTRRGSGQSSPRPTKLLPTSLRATSVDMPDASDSNGGLAVPTADFPSLDEQVRRVMALHDQPLSDRQEGYVVSEKWLARVFARTTENRNSPEQFDKSATEGEIGPVDNSDLVDRATTNEELSDQNGDDFIALRPGLVINQDFEVLPAEAWELIISWYGVKQDSPAIRRYVHNTALDSTSENLIYETYPPIFTIRRVNETGTMGKRAFEAPRRSPRLVASRADSYMGFLKAAKVAAGIDLETKVRVWRVLNVATTTDVAPKQASGMLTPDSSPRNNSPDTTTTIQRPNLFMDPTTFKNLAEGTEREQVTGKDETANEKYNGHMNLATAGLADDQILILEEQNKKGEYIVGAARADKSDSLRPNNTTASKATKGSQNSGRSTPVSTGPMTRGRTRNGRTRGMVGLTNLGNTCYMNSALQCIRSVQELSIYFLEGKYKAEINADNPLGHGGTIAKTYASLLASIYSEDSISAFAPKVFKTALGRAQPLFSGYGQQDSQEFLSFLVDALHEDLNRIIKKPYTENPESDDKIVHDPAAIKELGEKYRQIHHSRNDSVAMDLFSGFYKNTMVCPDCEKVSITFDPYSLVTLQLPIEQTWQHLLRFVPLYGPMYNLEVDIDKNATIKSLKEYVGKRFSVKWNRIMASEVYNHKFYRVLEDSKTIAECNIAQRDDIFLYELDNVPTNWPPKKKSQKYRSMLFTNASSEEDIPASSSPLGDKIVVPIFHRGPSTASYRSTQWSLQLWPSYIVVTREEAKDYDTILRKVLGKVAQMTTRPILTELAGTSSDQIRNDSDAVLTTDEDICPDGDPRVQDRSVEGEDNLVEVTMTEAAEPPMRRSSNQDSIPEVLRPDSFIGPEFRQLFEMKHTRAGKEMVPSGWSSVDHNKTYEAITKRIRLPPSRESSVQSYEETTNASSSEETDDLPQFSANAQDDALRLANQSSDEEMQSNVQPVVNRGGRSKKKSKKANKIAKKHKNNKNLKTYSKKGKDRFPERTSEPASEDELEGDVSLIRMGEAIILDWAPDAYDALFGGNRAQDTRGMDTSGFVETMEDAELQAKKAKRAARRKNGITLEECFAETSKSEVLSEDNAWYCGRCKELRRATKTLEIWTAPDILVIHLKRFSANRGMRDKIEALIDFPIEGLDLSGKVGLPEGKNLLYDLFAVDNHYGGLGGGHYTAYAQNFFDKQWYDYNDSSVHKLKDPNAVVTRNAYLLFYRRRSSGPLGPDYLQKIVNASMNTDSEEADDDYENSTSSNPSRSPAGNGLRLGDSSRNGSSSGLGAEAGAVVRHAGGSASAENPALNEAGAEARGDEALPSYEETDEGFVDYDQGSFTAIDMYAYQQNPRWSFSGVGQGGDDDEVFEEAASDAPNMGSHGEDDLNSRLLEDFGDEVGLGSGMRAGMGTPLDEVPPLLGGEQGDEQVADVMLDDEVGDVGGRIKLD